MTTTTSNDGGFIVTGPTEPALQDLTTSKLLQQQLDRHPHKVAIKSIWQKTTLTYQELFDSSREIAGRLITHGVRPKDQVIVLAGNTVEYLQLFFAVGGIGSVFTIINPTFTQEEVINAIDFIEPKAIFVSDRIGFRNNKKLLQEIAGKQHNASIVVQMGASEKVSSDFLSWDEFLNVNAGDKQSSLQKVDEFWHHGDAHVPLCIQFTSGTTGPRKAAMLSHYNLINNAYLVGSRLGMVSDDILCCSPPLFHCFGLVCGPLAVVTHGATAIVPSDVFNADSSLRACNDEGCTVINAVPTMFQAMLDHAVAQSYQHNLRLRTGIVAGSSLSETLIRRLSDEFGLSGLAYGFGMTELSCVSFMTDPTKVSLLEDRSSVGVPCAHEAAKVVDSDLKTLPAGSRGELLVSGYLMFNGYYKNESKTKETVVQDEQGRNWLRTGDLVTLSETGACMVVGRVKDMIKKGGENIAPSDIEKVLEQHAEISAAAVVGIPDVRWGELIAAYVRRAPQAQNGQQLDGKSVKLWLRNKIAPHKIPDRVFWIGEDDGVPPELPVNASGKVLKTELSANARVLVQA